jgi:hypothetical protein
MERIFEEAAMLMAKLIGLVAIIPVTILLTVSFFVLFTLRKTEGALKAFGFVIAALLWLSAFMVLSGGIYNLSTGRCPLIVAMHQMKMGMCPMMMKGGMMPPMMEGSMMHPQAPGMKGDMGSMKQGKAEEPAMKR